MWFRFGVLLPEVRLEQLNTAVEAPDLSFKNYS